MTDIITDERTIELAAKILKNDNRLPRSLHAVADAELERKISEFRRHMGYLMNHLDMLVGNIDIFEEYERYGDVLSASLSKADKDLSIPYPEDYWVCQSKLDNTTFKFLFELKLKDLRYLLLAMNRVLEGSDYRINLLYGHYNTEEPVQVTSKTMKGLVEKESLENRIEYHRFWLDVIVLEESLLLARGKYRNV